MHYQGFGEYMIRTLFGLAARSAPFFVAAMMSQPAQAGPPSGKTVKWVVSYTVCSHPPGVPGCRKRRTFQTPYQIYFAKNGDAFYYTGDNNGIRIPKGRSQGVERSSKSITEARLKVSGNTFTAVHKYIDRRVLHGMQFKVQFTSKIRLNGDGCQVTQFDADNVSSGAKNLSYTAAKQAVCAVYNGPPGS
jgi:hypothetical protein